MRCFVSSLVTLVFVLSIAPGAMAVHGAKNVILMIVDGGGFNQFTATSYYQYGALGQQVYDEPGWLKFGCTTYEFGGSYNKASMWSDFNWQKTGATDSASAATAMNTGVKTYDGYVNMDSIGNPLTAIAQIQDARGRATGAVTTVEISHATPACVWAHNINRGDFAGIANEMIYTSGLDVIMGAGHPYYNNDGVWQSTVIDDRYVGGITTWNQLKAGTTGKGWTFIQNKSDFQMYADDANLPAVRLIGIAQVNKTLQQERTGTAFNTNVPTLRTMSLAAINMLSKDPDGFFLMIEGGAVDWAGHDKQLNRIIEEQIDFNLAVEAVVNWVEQNSNWSETLLIVTADHETSCLWGSGSSGTTFNPIANNGVGVLPGATCHSNSHTNQLAPLYVRGVGSELFAGRVKGTDATAALKYGFSGQYVDNTDIFHVMNTVATAPYVCSAPIVSDVDDDCRVNFLDYATIASAWGQTPPPVDPVVDGTLDFVDIEQLAADWLTCTRLIPEQCWQ